MSRENSSGNYDPVLKKWRFQAIGWPILCLVFAGLIICLPGRDTEQRIADVGFTMISLVFFAIGMRMRKRLLRERGHATVRTVATVVEVKSTWTMSDRGRRNHYPVYEYQVGEVKYREISPSGCTSCPVTKGQEVELYYDPKNPKLFYAPAVQRHDRRWSGLLCGIGIVYPLVGLLAPFLRELFAFLP